MTKLSLYAKQALIFVIRGLFDCIALCLSKLMSQGPKLFCFFMLLPLYFAPEVVAQLADEHGLYMIAQPQFTHWIEMSFRFSLAVILGGIGFGAFSALERYPQAADKVTSAGNVEKTS